MKELMFDTSVYGELVDDDLALEKVAALVNTVFLAFGSSTVRGELDDTPAITLVTRGKFRGLNLRELILWLYKLIVELSGGEIRDSDLIEVLALRYTVASKKSKVTTRVINDFRIVAAASLHSIGLFVSADKSQISKYYGALYEDVNASYQLKTPGLVPFAVFKGAPENYANGEEK